MSSHSIIFLQCKWSILLFEALLYILIGYDITEDYRGCLCWLTLTMGGNLADNYLNSETRNRCPILYYSDSNVRSKEQGFQYAAAQQLAQPNYAVVPTSSVHSGQAVHLQRGRSNRRGSELTSLHRNVQRLKYWFTATQRNRCPLKSLKNSS